MRLGKSKADDTKVVEMKFDNVEFEKNVKESMSTLDKLKEKLKFKNADEGMKNVEKASGKVKFSNFGAAIDNVKAKFSALEVMGVTALANLTNSAVNAGKRIASAFTIEPIKTGFQEYETQINAIQTILANTESKGSTLQDVNGALAELNTYADKTIYNFTEMTRNIGTFTAAGVDLETSTAAIKGIANLAAVSGSTSQQASVAMYQLSQALSSGTVKLQDWNSVVNAGMGGQVFQDSLKETARVHGIAIDEMIKEEGSFRETLQNGWLTASILTETLQKFTGDLSEEQLKSIGYTDEQIKGIMKMGTTANDAATKVKTFTQLMDTLKEAAQSGWTQSWQIMIGNFEEAKRFLTDVSNKMGDILGKSADARNKILSEGLSSGWNQLLNAGISDEEAFINELKTVAKAHKVSIDEMVKNEKKLDDSLTDSEAFQKALSKGFKSGKLNSVMLSESIENLSSKITNMSGEELNAAGYTEENVKQIKKLSDEIKNGSINMDEFADKITKVSGRENIIKSLWNSFDALLSVLKPIKEAFQEVFPPMTGKQLYELTERLREFTSKLKLSEENSKNLKETAKGLFSIFGILKDLLFGVISGFKNTEKSSESLLTKILRLTAGIGKLITNFRQFIKDNKIFEGFGKIVASITRLIVNLVGIITDSIAKILGNTVTIQKSGDTINKVGDTLSSVADGVENFRSSINVNFSSVSEVFDNFGNFLGSFKESLGKVMSGIGEVLGKSASWASMLGAVIALLIPLKTIFGLAKKAIGIVDILVKPISAFGNLVQNLADGVKKITNSVASVLKGVKYFLIISAIGGIIGSIANIVRSIVELTKVDTGKMYAAIFAFSLVVAELLGFVKALEKLDTEKIQDCSFQIVLLSVSIKIISSAIKTIGSLDYGKMWSAVGVISVIIEELLLVMKKASSMKGDPKDFTGLLLSMGATLVLFAASIKILSTIDVDKLLASAFVLAALVAELAIVINSMKTIGDKEQVKKVGSTMLAMGATLLIIAQAIKTISDIDPLKLILSTIALGALMAELTIVMNKVKTVSVLSKKVGTTMMAMGVTLLLIASSIKTISDIDTTKALISLGIISVLMFELLYIMNKIKTVSIMDKKVDSTIIAMGATLLLISKAIKTISDIDTGSALVSAGIIAVLMAELGIIMYNIKCMDKDAKSLSGTMLAMGATLLIIANSIKILSELNPGKAILSAVLIGALMAELTIVVNKLDTMEKESKKAALTLLAMGTSLLLMANAIKIIANLNPANALLALGIVSTLMVELIYLLRLVNKNEKISLKAAGVVAIMAGTMLMLAAVVSWIANFPADRALASAASLSMILLSITTAFLVVNKSGGDKLKVKALATFAILEILVAGIAGILLAMSALEVGNSLENAKALSLLLVSMSASLLLLTAVGAGSAAAFIGLGALGTLIVGLGAILVGIGALMDTFPNIKKFLDDGIPILLKIGHALGSFFGEIIAGFANSVMNIIPNLGQKLAEFMNNADPFFKGIKNIDTESLEGVRALAETILILSAANILDGISAFLTGGKGSLEKFGEQLPAFGTALSEYSKNIENVDAGKVWAAARASEELAKMTNQVPLTGGLLQWIVGEHDLSKWGEQLASYGKALRTYFLSIIFMNDDTIKIIDKSIEASESLIEMTKKAPLTGGLIQWITGESNMETFGTRLAAYGKSLKSYYDSISFLTDDGVKIINKSVEASKSLIEMSNMTSLDGGLIQWIIGRHDLSTFGDKLSKYGKSLNSYYKSINGISNEGIVKIQMSTLASRELVELSNLSAPDGGLIQWIIGRHDLSTFGDKLSKYGKSLNSYYKSIKDISDAGIVKIQMSAFASKALVELSNLSAPDGGLIQWIIGRHDLSTFGSKLATYGKGLSDYYDAIKDIPDSKDNNGIGKIQATAEASKALAELNNALDSEGGLFDVFTGTKSDSFKKLSENLPEFGSGMASFAESLKDLDETAIEKFKLVAPNTKYIAEMIANLPEGEGIWQKVFGGGVNWKFVKEGMPALGESIVGFIDKVDGLTDDQLSVFKTVSEAISPLKDLIDSIPEVSAWDKLWGTGKEAGFKLFCTNLPILAKAFMDYANTINGIPSGFESNIEIPKSFTNGLGIGYDSDTVKKKLENVKNVTEAMSTLLESLPEDINNYDLEEFGNRFEWFALSLKTGLISMSEIDDDAFMKAKERLDTLIVDLTNFTEEDTKNMSAFLDAVQKLANEAISNFVEQFSKPDNVDTIKKSGEALINNCIAGADLAEFTNKGKDSVTKYSDAIDKQIKNTFNKGETLINWVINGISGKYSQIYNKGLETAQGFIDGIKNTDKLLATWNAGYELGQQALKGCAEAIDSHSPSKEFAKLGRFSVDGFVNQINDDKDYVENSVMKSFVNTIARAKERAEIAIGNGDFRPVIRPVMDMSDIESKAQALNNLINRTGSIGMTATIAYKASESFKAMKESQKNQNGSGSTVNNSNTNTTNNYFTINDANDPKKVAKEVRNIIQKQVERANFK